MEAGQNEEPQATEQQAFQALPFKEEKHAILAEAHRTIALQCRLQRLRSNNGNPDLIQQTLSMRVQAGEELRQSILTASAKIWASWKVMKVALSIPELQRDCTVAGHVLEKWPGAWKLVDSSVFSDRAVMLKVITRLGWWLEYASQQLQEDRDVVMAAVASDGQALRFASAALQADKAVVLAAARSKSNSWSAYPDSHGILRFASEELQHDKEVVLAAAASDGWNVKYASDLLKGDREVALAALRSNKRNASRILASLSKKLRADREVVIEAFRLDPFALDVVSAKLKKDEDFFLLAMRNAVPVCRMFYYQKGGCKILTRTKSWEDFGEVMESFLAVQGERAPVATVTLRTGTDSQQEQTDGSSTGGPSFEVTLLSGLSFRCSFPAAGRRRYGDGDKFSSGGDDEEDEWGEEKWGEEERGKEDENDGEAENVPHGADVSEGFDDDNHGTQQEAPPPKRRRLAGPEGQSVRLAAKKMWSGYTVGQLAKLVVRELPKHMEAHPPPDRVFLVISKPGDCEDVSVTPWDLHQRVTDFL